MADRNGLTGGVDATLPIAMIMSAFTAVAWVGVVELNILIFARFKRYRGLYFWSLLISSWGICIHALAFLFKFFRVIKNDYVSVTLITIGWYAMVTGQSVVLYSRLHLIVRSQHTLRLVLAMILSDAILLHVPTTVLTFGSNSPRASTYQKPYAIMEKIQVTGFCVQECIISGIYISSAFRIFRPAEMFKGERVKRMMLHLISVSVIIILLDIVLLSTEYANLYNIQTTFKSMLYTIKLKFEFAILYDLVTISHTGSSSYTLSSQERMFATTGAAAETVSSVAKKGNEFRNAFLPSGYAITITGGTSPHVIDGTQPKDITMTTEVSVEERELQFGSGGLTKRSESQTSSQIQFAHDPE